MIDVAMEMEQYDCPFIDTTDDYDVSFTAVHWEFDAVSKELETRLAVEGFEAPYAVGLVAVGAARVTARLDSDAEIGDDVRFRGATDTPEEPASVFG